MKPILLMSGWKIRNALRTTFSDPRKYGPLIFFTLFILGSIALTTFGFNSVPVDPANGRAINPEILRAITTFCMILLGLSVIDAGLGDQLLAFPMSDVDYIFPSPISRRIVLANRLPALTIGAIFFGGMVLIVFSSVTRFSHSTIPTHSHYSAPGWIPTVALIASTGTYFNLAMFVSIMVPNRSILHRYMIGVFVALGASIALIWWIRGASTLVSIANSNWVRIPFKPSSLASDILVAGFNHQPAYRTLLYLLIGYGVSLIPLFVTNTNWYEQSIASAERVSTIRQAAKGGLAGVMAAKSASFKHKGVKTYTVSPFGTGAMALFWAHLSAAWKKPFANFIAPAIGGIVLGFLAAAISAKNNSALIGIGLLAGITAYLTLFFMQIARTAAESSIRRRELLSPLPILGWQAVLANLGVPIVAFGLFCLGAALAYSVTGSQYWSMLAVAFVVFMPIRMASRMSLQYVVILGYPDLADKLQQVVSNCVYGVVALPLIVGEGILLIPSLILRSIWLGIFTLTIVQIPMLVLTLYLAGKASEKAIATGEPVNLWRLLSRQA